MLDTLGVTRQGYTGKERDFANSLGDHTSTLLSAGSVRKYDYETERFNTII